jgi:hypothetical protein
LRYKPLLNLFAGVEENTLERVARGACLILERDLLNTLLFLFNNLDMNLAAPMASLCNDDWLCIQWTFYYVLQLLHIRVHALLRADEDESAEASEVGLQISSVLLRIFFRHGDSKSFSVLKKGQLANFLGQLFLLFETYIMKEKRGRLVVSALNFFISLSTTKKGAKFLHEEQAGKLLLSCVCRNSEKFSVASTRDTARGPWQSFWINILALLAGLLRLAPELFAEDVISFVSFYFERLTVYGLHTPKCFSPQGEKVTCERLEEAESVLTLLLELGKIGAFSSSSSLVSSKRWLQSLGSDSLAIATVKCLEMLNLFVYALEDAERLKNCVAFPREERDAAGSEEDRESQSCVLLSSTENIYKNKLFLKETTTLPPLLQAEAAFVRVIQKSLFVLYHLTPPAILNTFLYCPGTLAYVTTENPC